jgi:hypothetical protein
MKQFLSIIGLCVAAAVLYGLVHDQITARVCIEYFTQGHVRIFEHDDPTITGLYWGVVATWWVGVLLGIPLAMAARFGKRPQRSARSLVRLILLLLGVMAAFALASGIFGYMVGTMGNVAGFIQQRYEPALWARFQACFFAHSMNYNVGFIGGGMAIAWVWVSRKPRGRNLLSRAEGRPQPDLG